MVCGKHLLFVMTKKLSFDRLRAVKIPDLLKYQKLGRSLVASCDMSCCVADLEAYRSLCPGTEPCLGTVFEPRGASARLTHFVENLDVDTLDVDDGRDSSKNSFAVEARIRETLAMSTEEHDWGQHYDIDHAAEDDEEDQAPPTELRPQRTPEPRRPPRPLVVEEAPHLTTEFYDE